MLQFCLSGNFLTFGKNQSNHLLALAPNLLDRHECGINVVKFSTFLKMLNCLCFNFKANPSPLSEIKSV